MNVTMHPSADENKHGGGTTPPSIGPAPGVLPEVQKPVLAENSQTGVSTRNVLSENDSSAFGETATAVPHWYVLRTTYSRERKACEYLCNEGIEAYCPILTSYKMMDGKRRRMEKSRIPNIFFAYGTFNQLKTYVYDNVNLSYLRFYYHCFQQNGVLMREPIVIPDKQMESLRIIYAQEDADIFMVQGEIRKFKEGQTVRIIDGDFKGVTGKVSRYRGQQRVAVIIDKFITVVTAYIPTAFLQIV